MVNERLVRPRKTEADYKYIEAIKQLRKGKVKAAQCLFEKIMLVEPTHRYAVENFMLCHQLKLDIFSQFSAINRCPVTNQ